MRTFPVFVEVSRAAPLAIGRGDLAVAKVRVLLTRAPRVALAAARVPQGLAIAAQNGAIELLAHAVQEADIRGRPLVVSATGDADEAEGRRLIDALLAGTSPATQSGRVTLVGAGPGDPELLTLKAVRALKAAGVILHDGLVGDGVLDYARREATIVDVGKRRGHASIRQRDINDLMIEHARAGKIVVRLKGGDAFIFARAAEEIAALEAAGIAVEIVPGITAAQACAADARLPLTYRGEVRQISFVTGATGDGEPDLDWPTLARPGQALAIYMGVRTAPRIAGALMAASAKSALPAVIVENGGRPEQRTIATTLGSLSTAIDGHAVRGPAILFLGLDWRRAWLRVPPGVETFPCPLPAILSRPSICSPFPIEALP